MIFVTVGSQMPFDRLIMAIDKWAALNKRNDIVAQIGKKAVKPMHIRWVETLSPSEFEDCIKKAELIVAHAGMGSIITALMNNKPIIVFPRLAKFRETRNDHQVASAQYFSEKGFVKMAQTEEELINKLSSEEFYHMKDISKEASSSLLHEIKSFIENVS